MGSPAQEPPSAAAAAEWDPTCPGDDIRRQENRGREGPWPAMPMAMAALGGVALCASLPSTPAPLSRPPPRATCIATTATFTPLRLAARVAPQSSSQSAGSLMAAPPAAQAEGRRWVPVCAAEGSAEAPAGGARALGLALAASLALGLLPGPTALPAHAEPSAEVGAVFQRSCAGCHAGGGNVLKPGAGLTKEELQRNNMLSQEALFDITYKGVGRMPGFGEGCAPKGQCTFGPRLSDEMISQLADYVLQNAEDGWQALS